jgi:hypothetical protein
VLTQVEIRDGFYNLIPQLAISGEVTRERDASAPKLGQSLDEHGVAFPDAESRSAQEAGYLTRRRISGGLGNLHAKMDDNAACRGFGREKFLKMAAVASRDDAREARVQHLGG